MKTKRIMVLNKNINLAKNTAILSIGKICTQCVNYFMLPLYTAVLSQAEFGTADLIISYVSLLTPLVGLQFDQGLFRFIIDERDDLSKQRTVFSSVIFSNILQILLFEVIACGFVWIVKIDYFNYILVAIPISILGSSFLQFLRGKGQNIHYAIISFLSATVQVLCNVSFLLLLDLKVDGLLLAMIIGNMVVIFYAVFVNKIYKYFSIYSIDMATIKEVSRYSLPLLPNQFAWWIMNMSDRSIITVAMGAWANGVYSIANKFSSLFITFYNYFNMAWTETLSISKTDADINRYISTMVNKIFDLLFFADGLLVLSMPVIFRLLINNSFSEAYWQIPILLFAVFLQAIQGLYGAIYVAFKDSRSIAVSASLAALINIIIDVVFVNYIGIFAASISTLVAFLFLTIFRYIDSSKYVNAKIDKARLIRAIILEIGILLVYYKNDTLINIIAFITFFIYAVKTNYRNIIGLYTKIKHRR